MAFNAAISQGQYYIRKMCNKNCWYMAIIRNTSTHRLNWHNRCIIMFAQAIKSGEILIRTPFRVSAIRELTNYLWNRVCFYDNNVRPIKYRTIINAYTCICYHFANYTKFKIIVTCIDFISSFDLKFDTISRLLFFFYEYRIPFIFEIVS